MTIDFPDRRRVSPWRTYGWAVAIAGATVLLRGAAIPWMGDHRALIVGVVPVALTAYLGGLRPGLLATGLIALGTLILIHFTSTLPPFEKPVDVIQWGAFLASGVVISLVCERLHRARRRMEEVLEEQRRAAEAREHLAAIVESSEDAIIGSDLKGVITSWNRGAERIFGYGAEEVVGRSIQILVPPERIEEEASIAARIAGGEAVTHVQTERVRKDGQRIEVSMTLSPVRDQGGRVIGSSKIARDVTEQRKTERQLAFHENVLREMGTIAKVGGWHFDPTTGEGYWTEEVARIHDLPPDTLVNKAAGLSYYQGESKAKIEAAVLAAIEHGTPYDLELELLTATGRKKWVRTIGNPIREGGRVVLVRGSFQDITERKGMELALREAQALYHSLVDQMPAGVFRKDAAGRFVFVNRMFCRMSGFTPEHYLGRTIGEIHGDLQRQPERDAVTQRAIDLAAESSPHHERIMRTGETLRVEEEWVLPDGGRRLLLAEKTPVYGSTGSVVGTQGVIFDITQQKQIEQALRQSEERFRQVVENIHEVFWMTDVEKNQMLYISPGYERIWGASCQSLYANPESWLAAIHSDDRERMRLAAQTREKTVGYDETYRIIRPDGEVRWIRDQAFPVADADGVIRRVVGVAEDVTESKTLQSQFLRAQRLEAIGTLSSGIAHDLNNILAPMLMVGPVLKEKLTDPLDHELVDLIETGAKRGANIIRQLLTFSRGIDGERTLVQPRHLIREMTAIMRETFPREIAISDSVPSHLWPVLADATQLHQVLLNLCVNARDAMPKGGRLSITAQNARVESTDAATHLKPKPGPHVMLSVADTGMGIPQHVLDRMFEPFFTTKELGKGTGLGLSTVLGVVKSHGGFITVYSEVGRGSVFKIYLPADLTSIGGADAERPTLSRGAQQMILIVDDEASIRTSLRRTLEAHNYRVLSAANGKEAIALFREQPDQVQLVMTDLMMPGMHGLALIRELRRLTPHLSILAASGLHDPDRGAELAALGVTEVLAKPCAPGEILEAVERALRSPRVT